MFSLQSLNTCNLRHMTFQVSKSPNLGMIIMNVPIHISIIKGYHHNQGQDYKAFFAKKK